MLKRLLLGRPLASAEQEHQRILKVVGLAVFSSDAISSTAYATEEILFVTAVGASSLALGLDTLVPIAIAVAVLLAIVVTSYRRTIFAYPGRRRVVHRQPREPGAERVTRRRCLMTMDFAFATVVTIAPIKAGETLTKQNLWVKRPGTGAIPAEHYEALLGKRAVRDLPADVHLALTDIG